MNDSRTEAAAEAIWQNRPMARGVMGKPLPWDEAHSPYVERYTQFAEVAVKAADANDAEHGIRRVQFGEDAVDRVARALFNRKAWRNETWDGIPDDLQVYYREAARAAINGLVSP